MTEAAPTVFVVDDDASCLRATARLLQAAGFSVATFSGGEALLAALGEEPPGCVIADLQMPGLDGLALQQTLSRAGHLLPVVFLTGHGDIPSSVRAMRDGAEDFLQKTALQAELVAAVRRAIGRNAHDRAARERRRSLEQRVGTLSPRERQVLVEVVRGRLNKQIAADLGIHERTVKLHRTSITTKLQAHSVAELSRLAQEAGLPQGDSSDLP